MSRIRKINSIWSTTWATLREIDVQAIGEESEHPFTIACCGQPDLLEVLTDMLYADTYAEDEASGSGAQYGAMGAGTLSHYALPLTAVPDELQQADMVVVVADGRMPFPPPVIDALEQCSSLSQPFLLVILYSETLPESALDDLSAPPMPGQIVGIVQPETLPDIELLALALLGRLPSELHVAAARSLPGLRSVLARDLIMGTAFSNGSYTLISTVSEQFPILKTTISAADMLVLTKNQILLVYRLALAHGAPADFQANLREVLTVIGLAYLWRHAARSLVQLFPVTHVAPKVAISYAGTYGIGLVAWRWFARGELVSAEQIRQVAQHAAEHGQQVLTTLQEQVRGVSKTAERPRRSLDEPR